MDLMTMKVLNGKEDIRADVVTAATKDDIRNAGEADPLHVSTTSVVNRCGLWCSERCCTLKYIKRRLPIITWLPKYSLDDFKGDLVAGITVALTVIPQGLALASLANLEPQYGLYTAFMGCFMYTIFGSCKDLTIGPTAIMSLMTAEHVSSGGVTYCILITFLTGCIQLFMGFLNLGFLVTFISSSVVSGFTSAAAITIATSQLAGIFGLKFKSEGFIEDISHLFADIQNVRYWDMTMGIICVVILILLKQFKDIKFCACLPLSVAAPLETLWWIIATARNALLVLFCTGLAALLLSNGYDNALTLTPEVKPGLPPFQLPAFSFSSFDNKTNVTIHKDFLDIVEDFGSGIAVIPLLCILEAIAIAKSFAKGKRLDASQEMIALGICNIMGSFVSSYPATGSFSRTAINYASGVRTPAGGIATGILVLLALGVMSPYFRYIPKASLSALIFVAVLNMVHYKDVIVMWRTNKWDLLPFFATFIFSFALGLEPPYDFINLQDTRLLGTAALACVCLPALSQLSLYSNKTAFIDSLSYGIVIGVGISLVLLLLQEAKPKIVAEERKTFHGASYTYVKPDRTVLFPSSEYLQAKITKSILEQRRNVEHYAVLLDGEHVMNADYTMAVGVKNMISNFKEENVTFVFVNLKMSVQRIIKGASPKEFLYFFTLEEAENFIEAMMLQHVVPAVPDDEKELGLVMGKDPSCDLETVTSHSPCF